MIHLDTNVVIEFLNGNKSVTEKIKDEIDKIALSAFVVAELDYGAKVSQKAVRNLEILYRFINIVQIVPFDLECAKMLGTIKSRLKNIGKPTGEVDAMIAAVAMANNAEFVTANKRHFDNIEGLKLKSWDID